jgi:uncharacterized protein (DUF1330 family)
MADDKIYMLNALWFKGESGRAKYAQYAAAAGPFVAALGGRLVESYVPDLALIGDWNPDLFFLVEWPNWSAFMALGQDAGYQKIAHLREEGLEKSLLIRCRRTSVPTLSGGNS